MQADGDMIGTTPVEVEVLPGALTVVVSEKPVPAPDQDLDRNKVMSPYLSDFIQTGRSK